MSDEDTSTAQQGQAGGEALVSFSGILQSRNIRIHNRRTSVRLEPEMWRALNEIAGYESCSIHDLCSAVYDLKGVDTSFTAALRVFLMEYYRAAAKISLRVSHIQKKSKSDSLREAAAVAQRITMGKA